MKTIHEFAEWVIQHRGDLSYGPDFNNLFRTAGGFVDKILKGTSAAQIPVFNPQVTDCVQVEAPAGILAAIFAAIRRIFAK
jgi:hypothetical protein